MTTFDFNCIFLLLNIKDKKGTAYCAQILCSVIFLKRELHCWGLLKKRKKSTCLFKTICRQLKLWVFQVKSIKSPSSNAWVSNTRCRGTKGLCHKASGTFFLCLSGCVWVISMKLGGVKEGSHRVPMDPPTIWNYCKKTRENSIFWLFWPKTALISGPKVPKMVRILPQDLWEY